MLIGIIPTSVDKLAIFVERRRLQNIRANMQLIQIIRDQDAFGIVPGTGADAIACRDTTLSLLLGAKIGTLCLAFDSCRFCQRYTMSVGTFEAAKISAIARPLACDEKAHASVLGSECEWRRHQEQGPGGDNVGNMFQGCFSDCCRGYRNLEHSWDSLTGRNSLPHPSDLAKHYGRQGQE